MTQSQVVQVVLVVLTAWCVSSIRIVAESRSEVSTVPEVQGKVFSMENEIKDLKLQVKEMKDLVYNISIQISTGKVFSMENEIRDLKLQVKEMKDLVYNISIQISRTSEDEKKTNRSDSRNANLKVQADKAEKRVVDPTCQVNISKPVLINGLNEQILKDIKSKDWSKTVALMRRYLNHNTLAYEQLDNITKHYNNDISFAAIAGYVELIQVMLDNGVPINTRYGSENRTMLHRAAFEKHCKLVNVLIQRGADVNARDRWDYIPLHSAAQESDDVNIVQLLLDSGADIDTQDKRYHNTPLHYAAQSGHESVVQYLVNEGCDTTIINKKGKTAADKAKTEKIKKIIQKMS